MNEKLTDIVYGLKTAQDYYNSCCQGYKVDNHYFIPDNVGWADGRVCMQIDNDKISYFPDIYMWKLNNVACKLHDILRIVKGYEIIFWTCLKSSVGSENLNFDWESLLTPFHNYSDTHKVKYTDERYVFEEPVIKADLKFLQSIVGELDYLYNIDSVYVFNSSKYGKFFIKFTTYYDNCVELDMEKKTCFPKTYDYLLNQPRFYNHGTMDVSELLSLIEQRN